MSISHIFGQDRVKKILQRILLLKRVPHAYLFCGIPGVGKKSMARALAMALNCEHPVDGWGCGQCPSCRGIASNSSPDFMVFSASSHDGDPSLEPSRKILIEHIRELNTVVSYPPIGKYRVSVLDNAGEMTLEAANSFLKTLEEPPPCNLFILNTVEPLDMLPTVVSRCQKITFQPLLADDIKTYLKREKDLDDISSGVLAALSFGSLGKAISLLERDFLPKRKVWLSTVKQIPFITEAEAFLLAVEHMDALKGGRQGSKAGTREDLLNMFLCWKSWYRDLMLIKEVGQSREHIVNRDYMDELEKQEKFFDVDALSEIMFMLDRSDKDIQNNMNMALLLEQSIMNLWHHVNRTF